MNLSTKVKLEAQGAIKITIKNFLDVNNLIYHDNNLEDVSGKLMNFVIYRTNINEEVSKYVPEAVFTFEFFIKDYLKNNEVKCSALEIFLLEFDPVKESISFNVYDLINTRFSNFDCNDISTIIGHLIFEDYKSNIFCLTKCFINGIIKSYLYRLLNIGSIYEHNPNLQLDAIFDLEKKRSMSPNGVEIIDDGYISEISDATY